jgi:hypothetical protein
VLPLRNLLAVWVPATLCLSIYIDYFTELGHIIGLAWGSSPQKPRLSFLYNMC